MSGLKRIDNAQLITELDKLDRLQDALDLAISKNDSRDVARLVQEIRFQALKIDRRANWR